MKQEAIKVDGLRDASGSIEYWGLAMKQPNGKYECLANVAGHLCRVEVSITFLVSPDQADLYDPWK